MSEDKFTLKQRKLLLQAQKVIDEASVGYVDILKQHIQKLKTSLDSGNITEAVHICHRIQSQAGTFGWPLAGEISGWFKRILITPLKSGVNSNVHDLFSSSLNTVLQDELKAESDAAVKLLIHIETMLKQEGIR